MLESIVAANYQIHFNESVYHALNEALSVGNYSKIFILVDENTHELCLPEFLPKLETKAEIEIIEIPAGEAYKQVSTCSGVWESLSERGADRRSLLINLGGGVVTDLGGFVAATFMRGIDFINVPTTLLAMVDASVGGKTGVDLGAVKNQVGVIINPLMVLIETNFLKTLPADQLRSGLAEMLKHGLIKDAGYWERLEKIDMLTLDDLDALVHRSVVIKNEVVTADPTEKGLRKILNFGHTLGHAIETFYLQSPSKPNLLHGEAIAIGMIAEAYMSHKQNKLSENQLQSIKEIFGNYFDKVIIAQEDYEPIIELMKFDKKNTHGRVNFVLLENIGKATIDHAVSNELIASSLDYYNN